MGAVVRESEGCVVAGGGDSGPSFQVELHDVVYDRQTGRVSCKSKGTSTFKKVKRLARGGMRMAEVHSTRDGMRVLKLYLTPSSKEASGDSAKVSLDKEWNTQKMHLQDAAVYLRALFYAERFNEAVQKLGALSDEFVKFVQPEVAKIIDGPGVIVLLLIVQGKFVEGAQLAYAVSIPPLPVQLFLRFADFASRPFGGMWARVEPYLGDDFCHFSDNDGGVDWDNPRNTPHAFSHFTFEESGGEEIVVDIQGVGNKWTDPQIHSEQCDYGAGNLGDKGIAKFFSNNICQRLGLSEFKAVRGGAKLGQTVLGMGMPDAKFEGVDFARIAKVMEGLDDKPSKDVSLRRGSDAKMCYSKYAGMSTIAEAAHRDQYGNAFGTAYDLGLDGAFKGLKIAVLHLYTGEGFDFSKPLGALTTKGFEVHRWTEVPSPKELEDVLKTCCQCWVISTSTQTLGEAHADVLQRFYNEGNGLYLWGDNDPYHADANFLGLRIFGSSMAGYTQGDKQVQLRQTEGGPGFKEHLITTGVENLYEGISVATVNPGPDMEPLMWGSASNLIIAIHDRDGKRAVFDGAFTRLFWYWDQAGSTRYVVNAAVWLVNLEARCPGNAYAQRVNDKTDITLPSFSKTSNVVRRSSVLSTRPLQLMETLAEEEDQDGSDCADSEVEGKGESLERDIDAALFGG
uniref:Alpha-type protein kinase domain-containing protein n=1 Tax=Chromera velia CCMP2878 TaxID=1169474 RepID=A0A0G4I0P9_9ALVE|eukprot:Cvel_1636.t1-p1 / transcript=Cvel_1636.t1 / gene=Cvel_1636 / organism=Chromera_velia_CCMP2878 / gene_product=Eukaryotic elongation factor 2 kinase, putative / transcript_product=Eukaryotic elongation factor 2 kinase, putative / location=Cvel_scaffold58:133741-136910(-) / protein_length=679 / sequence_SO=supercontig / SO=protein_coding / is_pseudo=false